MSHRCEPTRTHEDTFKGSSAGNTEAALLIALNGTGRIHGFDRLGLLIGTESPAHVMTSLPRATIVCVTRNVDDGPPGLAGSFQGRRRPVISSRVSRFNNFRGFSGAISWRFEQM